MFNKTHIIGAVAELKFLGLSEKFVPARVDTGAKTSAVWASQLKVNNGELSFYLFDKNSPYYDGHLISTRDYTTKIIRSTNGLSERRYVVKLPIIVNGRKIKASFTLANRERQAYPVLLGRNVLRGKFIVDIKHMAPTEGRT